MKCAMCGCADTRVIDTRDVTDGIRRRRECLSCGYRYTTYERATTVSLLVVKRDERRERFDRDKLLRSMQGACGKRPVAAEALEEATREIEAELFAKGEGEVPSKAIGDMVMKRLRRIDGVAYVRFASICGQYDDVEQMAQLIEKLQEQNRRRLELENQMELPLGPVENIPQF